MNEVASRGVPSRSAPEGVRNSHNNPLIASVHFCAYASIHGQTKSTNPMIISRVLQRYINGLVMRGSTAGLTEALEGNNPIHRKLLATLDALISCFLVAPLVVCYWRSIWMLMQVYVFPQDEFFSALISTSMGIFGHIFFNVSQESFERNFHPDKNRLVYYVVSRLYTVCFAVVCVNGWRGPWILIERVSSGVETDLGSMVIAAVFLAAMKVLRNVSAPPFTLINDFVPGYFQVVTMFKMPVCSFLIYAKYSVILPCICMPWKISEIYIIYKYILNSPTSYL